MASLPKNSYEIIHTKDIVKGTDSPLEAAKEEKKLACGLL